MAWQYFTDFLEPGDLITKDQRNELLDAFYERVIALKPINSTWDLDSTFLAAVKNSHIMTDRVTLLSPLGSADTVSLASAIAGVSRSYYREDDNFSLFPQQIGNSNYIHRLAALDLGLTNEEYQEISPYLRNASSATTSGSTAYNLRRQQHHQIWNILRRSIQLLKWVSAKFPVFSRFEKSATETTWVAARDNCLSSSETSIGSGSAKIRGSLSGGFYTATVVRHEYDLELPDIDGNFRFALRLRSDGSSTIEAPARFGFNSEFETFTALNNTSGYWVIFETEFEVSGSVTADLKFLGYDDPIELDAVEPISTTVEEAAATSVNPSLIIQPSWTHPYEEIE